MEEQKCSVVEIKEEVDTSEESERWRKRSIYRVPKFVTKLNPGAYEPQIVSIGPYHHCSQDLRPMEEHKHRALLHFLQRPMSKPLKDYVEALTTEVQHLKDAYDQLDDKWQQDTEAFVQMMILDGCFILEILRTTAAKDPQKNTNDRAGYVDNDPIFSNHGKLYIVPYLKRDMLMLENQIPMAVLEKLVSVQGDHLFKGEELIKHMLDFFSQRVSVKKLQNCSPHLHMLNVYRKSLLVDETSPQNLELIGSNQGMDEIIRSATELHEAGISFEKSKTRSLKDITFCRRKLKSVLRLPLIVVDDLLESLYLNLIAFERFHVGAGNEVTSYIFFMDSIIDNARDVSLLHERGVIQNAVGSDKAVANLFNSLSKDITLDPKSPLFEVHKQVHDYCQSKWHRLIAYAKHNYFTNPLVTVSVFAALFLFGLTILQTVYTTLGYYKEN